MVNAGEMKQGGNAVQLKSEPLFDMMRSHLKSEQGKEVAKKNGHIYAFKISPKKLGVAEQTFIVDLKNLDVYKGERPDIQPDATFGFVDADFVAAAAGKRNPQTDFLMGKMTIKGNLGIAMKWTPSLFPKPAKL